MADPPSRVNQDDVSGSLTVQAGLGEGLGQDAVRLPASDEPGVSPLIFLISYERRCLILVL